MFVMNTNAGAGFPRPEPGAVTAPLLFLILLLLSLFPFPVFAGPTACQEISQYEKIHRARPTDQTRKNLATLYNNCGIEYSNKNQWNSAEQYLQKARSLDPKNLMVNISLANIIANRGDEAFKNGDMRKAKDDFQKALRYNPNDGNIKAALSETLYRLESSSRESHELLKEGASQSLMGGLWKDKVKSLEDEAEFQKYSREVKKGNWILRVQEGLSEIDIDQVFRMIEEISQKIGKDFSHWIKERLIFVLVDEKQFSKVHSGPGWAAALNDGRIKIPVTGHYKDPIAFKAVLAHEYTHSVVNHYARTNKVPFWVHEGLAEYEERKITGQNTINQQNFPILYEATKQKKWVPMEILNDMQATQQLPGAAVALAYEQSAAFVLYVEEFYYFHSLLSLLKEIGKGTPIDEAIRLGISRNLKYLETEYHSWLQQKFAVSAS